MRVLTLNTWQERGPWKERWEVLFRGLDHLRPDLIFFQEIFNAAWVQEVSRRSGLESQVYYDAVSGLALLSRYPVLDSGSHLYQNQSDREDYPRYLLYAQFKTPRGAFFAFNTHLSWKLEDGCVRAGQTREIADCVQRKAGGAESLIAGDFNAVSWSPEVRYLTEEAGFCDTFPACNPNQPGLTWTYDNIYTREGRHPLPDRRIDYIFSAGSGLFFSKPKSIEVVYRQPSSQGVLASDHYGVFAEFEEASDG